MGPKINRRFPYDQGYSRSMELNSANNMLTNVRATNDIRETRSWQNYKLRSLSYNIKVPTFAGTNAQETAVQ